MMRVNGSIIDVAAGDAVVRTVDLPVEQGRILLVVGGSGTGKSLLARAICGLLPASLSVQGSLEMPGAVYVGEDPDSQVTALSVEDEVASALEFALLAREEIAPRVEAALAEVGLAGFEHRNPWELSGGQRQRLSLACALARDPRVLVLDNPFGNIDVAGRARMKEMLRRFACRGCAVVVFQTPESDHSWADCVCALAPSDTPRTNPAAVERFAMAAAHHPGSCSFEGIGIEGLVLGPDAARLDGVSLLLEPGTVNVLRGDNGCGKTSLMAAIAGAARPSSGRFVCQGAARKRLPAGLVAWSQQNPERHFTQHSVERELELALEDASPDGPLSPEAIRALPAAFGFTLDEAVSPFSLSAGGKRRLSLLLCFMQNRPLTLLDEPAAGLDDSTALKAAIDAFVRGGGCVLMSSHEDEVPAEFRIVRMRAGRIVGDGSLAEEEIRDSRRDERAAAGGVAPEGAGAGTPSPADDAPVFNPLATLTAAILLVAFGVACETPAVVFSAALACVAGVAVAGGGARKTAGALFATAIAATAFGLMALRGNAGDALSLYAVAHHAGIGAIFLSASVLASSLFTVPQLFDAASQVLRVPYTWCTLAISGFSIGTFLRSVSSLVTAAIRLRCAHAGQTLRNAASFAALPLKTAFPLFIESIRYAQRLNVTLESRGFGSHPTKTFRRQYPWRPRETVLVAFFALLVIAEIIL